MGSQSFSADRNDRRGGSRDYSNSGRRLPPLNSPPDNYRTSNRSQPIPARIDPNQLRNQRGGRPPIAARSNSSPTSNSNGSRPRRNSFDDGVDGGRSSKYNLDGPKLPSVYRKRRGL